MEPCSTPALLHLRHLLPTILSGFKLTFSRRLYLVRQIILGPLTVNSNMKNLPVAIRGTNKPLCLVITIFCLGVPQS